MESKRLSLQDVQRIIDAVDDGKEKLSPDDIDKQGLADELSELIHTYQEIHAHSKDWRNHQKLVDGVRERARFLLSIFELKADEPASHVLLRMALFPNHQKGGIFDAEQFTKDEGRFNALISSLQWLSDLPQVERRRPLLLVFVAQRLAAIYENRFPKTFGRSRAWTGGEPYGPYVRFVQAVCAAFGMDISAETIAAYVRREKRARNSIETASK